MLFKNLADRNFKKGLPTNCIFTVLVNYVKVNYLYNAEKLYKKNVKQHFAYCVSPEIIPISSTQPNLFCVSTSVILNKMHRWYSRNRQKTGLFPILFDI